MSQPKDLPSGYPHPSSSAVTAAMKGNKRANTKPEVALRSALHRRGNRFRKDFPIELPGAGRRPRPDIAFTRQQIAVFVDGCFWHGCPEHGRLPKVNPSYWDAKLRRNRERDERDTALLEAAGWDVIRVWEHVPVNEAVERVERVIHGQY